MMMNVAALIAATESRLVDALALVPLALPSELSALHGSFKGSPVTLHARAYTGLHTRYARIVSIAGDGLAIVNVLALPEPEYPLPILGIDVVMLRGASTIVVADLSPVTADVALRDRQNQTVHRHVSRRPALASAGPLPEWCSAWFSPHALFARLAADDDHDTVAPRLADYIAALQELAGVTAREPVGAADAAARQQAYCDVHLSDDRGLQLTRRMFDPNLADRFLSEVLFPVRGAVWQ